MTALCVIFIMHHGDANAFPITTVSTLHGESVVARDQEVNDDISIDQKHNYRTLAAISAALCDKSGTPKTVR